VEAPNANADTEAAPAPKDNDWASVLAGVPNWKRLAPDEVVEGVTEAAVFVEMAPKAGAAPPPIAVVAVVWPKENKPEDEVEVSTFSLKLNVSGLALVVAVEAVALHSKEKVDVAAAVVVMVATGLPKEKGEAEAVPAVEAAISFTVVVPVVVPVVVAVCELPKLNKEEPAAKVVVVVAAVLVEPN